jgi:hypothetical protein
LEFLCAPPQRDNSSSSSGGGSSRSAAHLCALVELLQAASFTAQPLVTQASVATHHPATPPWMSMEDVNCHCWLVPGVARGQDGEGWGCNSVIIRLPIAHTRGVGEHGTDAPCCSHNSKHVAHRAQGRETAARHSRGGCMVNTLRTQHTPPHHPPPWQAHTIMFVPAAHCKHNTKGRGQRCLVGRVREHSRHGIGCTTRIGEHQQHHGKRIALVCSCGIPCITVVSPPPLLMWVDRL